MANPFKTTKFQKLRDKWYAKLEREGFEDKEQLDGNLKVWESTAFQNRYSVKKAESITEYFRLASEFLHERVFMDNRERAIWEMHCNGATRTEISENLRKQGFKKWRRTNVHYTLASIEKEMLAKYGKRHDRPKRTNHN